MYALAERARPRLATSRSRARRSPRWRWPGSRCVGEFHYLHHAPGGTPYDDPNAMGEAVLAGGARGRACASRCSTRATCTAASTRFRDARRRRVGRSASTRSPSAGRRAVGAAIHSVRAVDPDVGARWSPSGPRRGAPLHAHVSEQPAENEDVPRRVRRARRPRCSPTPARSSRALHRGPRHAPDRRRRRAARRRGATSACARRPSATSPTASARRGGCATPARALAARQRLARGDRPVRGGARDRARRAAGDRRARPPPRRRRCSRPRPPAATRASAGPTAAGSSRARSPTSPPSRSTACAWPARAPSTPSRARRVRGDRRRRPRRDGRRRAGSCATARHIDARRRRRAAEAIALAHEHARRRQHRAAGHQRPDARRGPARPRPRRRARDRGRPRRRGRARGRRGRRADRRRRALRDPGLRRQPHAPRVRRRPRRRVRGADGRRAVRGRRHPRDDRRDPRGRDRASSPALAARAPRRGAARRHHPPRDQVRLRPRRRRPSARCCEVAARLTDDVTFLGAHVVPAEYEGRADDYVDARHAATMLAACAPHARWIDVFCEEGAFDADQSRAVLEAGRAAGLGLRVHANQLGPGPGRAARRRAGRRLGRPLHLPDRRRRRRARRRRHRRHVPPRHRLLDPPALPRRAPRDRRRRAASRSPPTATPARATRPRWRSASRSPSATCA